MLWVLQRARCHSKNEVGAVMISGNGLGMGNSPRSV